MEQEDRDLLIRMDERQQAMSKKLDRHIEASEKWRDETQKEIKSINRWRFGVVGSMAMSLVTWIKGM